jgi:hypothetical protein
MNWVRLTGACRCAHSARILSARIALPHFSVSSATNLPKSVGVIDIGTPAYSSKSRNYLWIGECRIDFFLELVDNFGRRALRRDQTIPHACLIARYKLTDGRDVGQRLRTCPASHRKGAQLARPDLLDRRWYGTEYHCAQRADEVTGRLVPERSSVRIWIAAGPPHAVTCNAIPAR